jgi:hypothetical protein
MTAQDSALSLELSRRKLLAAAGIAAVAAPLIGTEKAGAAPVARLSSDHPEECTVLLRYTPCRRVRSQQVRIVTAAFDQTWQAVQDAGTPFASNGVAEATGDVVALRIIAMARLGELDCDRIREGALRQLAEMKETATQPRGD